MSYDLMVFDPKAAPAGRPAFRAWYKRQTDWQRGYNYNDPNHCTPQLRAWFDDMVQSFPPLNGPFATHDFNDDFVADYSIGPLVIYMAFGWTLARPAYDKVFTLAQKHRVGFYDVSGDEGDGLIWTPPAA